MFEFGVRELYDLLPFRAAIGNLPPAAIERKWEVATAASRVAEWRLWFTALDQAQQQARVQTIAERTKHKFWTGLCPVYEEWSQRRHTRFVSAAARALILVKNETGRMQLLSGKVRAFFVEREVLQLQRDCEGGALARVPPQMPHDVVILRVRLAPSYFRLPANAFRFATQIFSGKSYDEAVAEQKANFNSWAAESKVFRGADDPDQVVWGNRLVHKDVAARLTLRDERKLQKEKLREERLQRNLERRKRNLERAKLREERWQKWLEEEALWEDVEDEAPEEETLENETLEKETPGDETLENETLGDEMLGDEKQELQSQQPGPS